VKTALLYISILLFSLSSFAQNCPVLTDEDGNVIGRSCDPISTGDSGTGGSTTSSGSDTINDGENLDDISGFNNATSGAEQNAQQSAGDSGATQMLGMIMGAMFMAMCNKPPGNIAPCIMGAMSFIDAMASGGNKGNSTNFGNSLLSNGGDTGDTTDESAVMAQEAEAQLQALEEMGFVSNADGSVTAPNGETFTGGDLASTSALEAKGIGAGQAQAALDLLKTAREKAAQEVGAAAKGRAIASVGGAGGGGAAGPLPDLIIDEEGGAFSKGKSRKNKIGRIPANEAAKLSKNFNGTPIGIAGADIFLIVTRKYEDKDKQKSFINKEY
jgi:hypothetical protein